MIVLWVDKNKENNIKSKYGSTYIFPQDLHQQLHKKHKNIFDNAFEIYEGLEYHEIPYECKHLTKGVCFNSEDYNIILVAIPFPDSLHILSALLNIEEYVYDLVKNQGQIILNACKEAFPNRSELEAILRFINDFCVVKNIPPESIKLISNVIGKGLIGYDKFAEPVGSIGHLFRDSEVKLPYEESWVEAHDFELDMDDRDFPGLNHVRFFNFWPTRLVQLTKYQKKYKSLEKKYDFCWLSGNPAHLRIFLFDKLYRCDLLNDRFFYTTVGIENSFFAWPDANELWDISLPPEYLKEHLIGQDNEEISMDLLYNTNYAKRKGLNTSEEWILPKVAFESHIHVVVETALEAASLTEKTYKPLEFGLPFLLLGAPKINQTLEDLGFILYDEIFNYSFDEIYDTEKRMEQFAAELLRVSKLPLEELCEHIKPKLLFNQYRMAKLRYEGREEFLYALTGEDNRKYEY